MHRRTLGGSRQKMSSTLGPLVYVDYIHGQSELLRRVLDSVSARIGREITVAAVHPERSGPSSKDDRVAASFASGARRLLGARRNLPRLTRATSAGEVHFGRV